MLKRICHMKNIEYNIIPLDSFVKQAYIEKDGKKIVSIPWAPLSTWSPCPWV